MNKKERPIIIIGSGIDCDLSNMVINELKELHPNAQIVTAKEAKEKGLSETFLFKEREKVAIEPIILKETNYSFKSGGLSKRAARRKAERDEKKRKRFR